MRIVILLVGLVLAERAARAEDLGPFVSTPEVPAALQCRAPKLLQRQPSAACGKKVYLVIWSDGSQQPVKAAADIYCARIEVKTGKCLDPKGILLCKADYDQGWPAVAFDGTNFLVVWQDFRNGKDYDIYASRVTEEGKVLDPDGFAVAARAHNQARPAVGFANGHYLVAWMDGRRYPVYSLYAARVTPEGKCLDPEGRELDAEPQANIDKVAPKDGKWLGNKEYWWLPLCSRASPAIASNGKKCLLAYGREVTRGQNNHVEGALLLVDPATGSPAGAPTLVNRSDLRGSRPALVATPNGWLLAVNHWILGWGNTPTLTCLRLDAQLKTADRFGTSEKGALDPAAPFEKLTDPPYASGKGESCAFQPAVAWNGKHGVVAMDYGWRGDVKKKESPGIRTAILLNRCDANGSQKFLDAQSVRLAASEDTKGVSVGHPVLVAGPDGELLLVYEKDAGIDNCAIVTRLIREK